MIALIIKEKERFFMIQVIQRLFEVLEILKSGGDCSLKELTENLSLNKATLCNILRTAIELKYIERSGRGNYRLSSRFYALTRIDAWHEVGYRLMKETVSSLAEELGESIVAGTLRREKVAIIVQIQAERKLMINPIVYENLSLYHSVTGRVLLAFSDAARRRFCFDKYAPPKEEWNGIIEFDAYENACAEIREKGISIMENPFDGIKSFAVPILDSDGDIAAALALTMPLSRIGDDGGKRIKTALLNSADKLMQELCSAHLNAADFVS